MEVSKNILLQKITKKDHLKLYNLMVKIYPPAYIDYWKDKGEWYVNDLYNLENFDKELKEKNTDYYFVLLEEKTIGIMRVVYGIDIEYKEDKNYIKLHRLYLDQSIQSKGIGSQIMKWLIDYSKEKGFQKLWLEVMEKQPQALHFYQKLGFQKIEKVFLNFPLLYKEYRGMYKVVKKLTSK